MNNELQKEVTGIVGSKEMNIITGKLAKQAHGSVVVKYGETIVLGTATMGHPMSPDADFLPLLVEYDEKFYAAGKIKGSRFMKREGKPHDDAILTARLIDRSIRPLFPKGMINDVQVVLTVLSYDGVNDPDVLAMIAACGALMVSGIPWEGPLGATRVGMVDGAYVINPTMDEREKSKLDLLLAGTAQDISMLEAGAHEIPESAVLDAIELGQKGIGEVVNLLTKLQGMVSAPLREAIYAKKNEDHITVIENLCVPLLRSKLSQSKGKDDIAQAERDTVIAVLEQLSEEQKEDISEHEVRSIIHIAHGKVTRDRVLEEDARSDGRALTQVRPLAIDAGVLPRAHGTGLFQRGDTQVLTVLTLGGPDDSLIVDTIRSEEKKRYIHYYNFPAFSVGEIRPSRGPGRREIGHGALAERALLAVLPEYEKWPYTMLLVSEVLESNGSSSMASVCGSSLALMDAGVPITRPVAGIAMGLMSDGKAIYKVITDIAGMEDEKGDMDFKVAGTEVGITALQMDIKVTGLTRDILSKALEQAREARMHILGEMNKVLDAPRSELSKYAPRIHTMRISVEKIGDLIGPKGKNINEIIDQTGASISVEDDGLVAIVTNDGEAMERAIKMVSDLTREIKVGDRFEGKVVRIMDFGAFVQLVPNIDGLVHISQFRDERVESVSDVVKVGDVISVVVLEIDQLGRINLSHKATKK
ncbi:MAG TPA: polyribonucleotide nucleotidyltransferase [Candidatus Andersenbacteria bacterium]|nr:polyribonucleotide nucleotidyltransferase [Candidatus Andersenbacteria bacterium]